MSDATAHGLAAALELDFNLLVVFTMVMILIKWFDVKAKNSFLTVIHWSMNQLFHPIRLLLGNNPEREGAIPFIFLGLIVPMQIFVVSYLRH